MLRSVDQTSSGSWKSARSGGPSSCAEPRVVENGVPGRGADGAGSGRRVAIGSPCWVSMLGRQAATRANSYRQGLLVARGTYRPSRRRGADHGARSPANVGHPRGRRHERRVSCSAARERDRLDHVGPVQSAHQEERRTMVGHQVLPELSSRRRDGAPVSDRGMRRSHSEYRLGLTSNRTRSVVEK